VSLVQGALEAWSAFLHAREPATTIAAFRILFGLLLVANGLLFARQARLWIGESGVLPRAAFLEAFGRSRFTLLGYLPGADGWAQLVLALHLLAAVSLCVGFATRGSAAVAFLTLLSLQHRNPLVLYGADYVLRVMTFLLIFSRAGETWSVDHWLAARAGAPLEEASAWCTRLMQMQVSILYFKAAVAKLEGATWRDGTAVHYALEATAFRRARRPVFARTLAWSRLATWGTVALELALAAFLWVPGLRYPVLVAGALFHALMDVFMSLQLFGMTMIVCLLLFVEPAVIDRSIAAARAFLVGG